MKIALYALCLLAACTLPAMAQSAKPPARSEAAPAAQQDPFEQELARMAAVVKLTPDQQKQIRQKDAALKANLQAFKTANAAKFDRLNKELQAAAAAKNEAKVKELRGQMVALTQKQEQIIRDGIEALFNVMTPQQRTTWETYNLQQAITARLQGITLSQDQTAKIKTLCQAAVASANKIPKDDQKARAEVQQKLFTDVEKQVLTAQQRETLAVNSMEQAITMRYRSLQFTPAQTAKIRTLCKTTIQAANKLPEKDTAGRIKLQQQLVTNVEQVLTAAQRAQLKAEEEQMKARYEQMQKDAQRKAPPAAPKK